MQDALESIRGWCRENDREYLVAHWDRLTDAQRRSLEAQIRSIDFGLIDALVAGEDTSVDWPTVARRAMPPNAIQLSDPSAAESTQEARQAGRAAIANGKLAMILVAGGQGTRLGIDMPKGMFSIGPVSNRTLFEMHVDSLRAMMQRHRVSIPLCIMTSPATDAQTREYFQSHARLGLQPEELIIFCQGTMPAVSRGDGRILLEGPDRIALSPDGHGGVVLALQEQGVLDRVRKQGIEHFFYAQVDNPLVTACDEVLVGYHVRSRSEMTTQVVRKRFALEKVGNVVSVDGRTHIIEYSDLPGDIACLTDDDGRLKLWAGNIAVHVVAVDFLARAAQSKESLPFHRAIKSVPFVSPDGSLTKPAEPNAIKFERFVFDLLPIAERSIVVEAEAAEVFAPVKNAEGAATDTATTCRQALCDKHRRWLESAGAMISSGVKVEINPLWALDAEQVRTKIQDQTRITVDTYLG